MFLLAKYGVQTDIRFPMVKRSVVDLAVSADWTPATGDTKIMKDGGAIANTTNNPSVIASSADWVLTLTAAELTAGEVNIQIVDSATKAVEDQFIIVYTYGNASAKIPLDLSISQTGDSYARIGANGVSLSAIPDEAGITTLLARLTSTRAGYLDNLSAGAVAQASVLGAAVGATISADIAAIKALLPTALAGDGSMKASVQSFLGTAFTEGASGRIASAFKQFFNIASPAATMDHGVLVDTATNLTNAPGAGDFTTTMKTSLNAATPAVTVSDKTGFSLSAGGIQAIWDALTSALTTVGSIGKLLVTNVDATTSSRLASSSYTAPDNADIVLIKAKTDNLPATPAATGDAMTLTGAYDAAKTASQAGDAMALTSGERTTLAGVIWDRLTSAITAVGSIGKLIKDNLDATVSSRLASGSYTAPDNADIATIKAWTDSSTPQTGDVADLIPARIIMTGGKVWALDSDGNALTSGGGGGLTEADVRDALGMASADLDTQLDAIKTSADAASRPGDAMALTSGERTTLVAAVWDALTSGFTTVGSIGKLIKDNLDTRVSSKLSADDYTTPDNASITAIKAKTDNLPVSPAATGDAMTLTGGERTSIAAAILAVTYEGSESVRDFLRLARAVLYGKSSGQPTAPVYRAKDGTTPRVTGVVDTNGNRTNVTTDPS